MAAQPIFLSFFERYNVWLTDTLGDAVNWHPTLNFARVVRNAIDEVILSQFAKSASVQAVHLFRPTLF